MYAAREQPTPGVSGKLVVEGARAEGADVHWVPLRAALAAHVAGIVRTGDVVLTMGAGDVTGVGRELLDLLAGRKGATV